MSDVEKPPLPQGVAYGLVCGFGIVFALTMNGITWVSRKYLNESSVRPDPLPRLNVLLGSLY